MADVRQFDLSPRRFTTTCGGLFLFLPDLVRLGIDPELTREKVLQEVHVAQEVDVRRDVNVIGEKKALFKTDTIPVGRPRFGRFAGRIHRADILCVKNVVGSETSVAAVFLAVLHFRIKTQGGAELGTEIRTDLAAEAVAGADGEVVGGQQVGTPARIVAGQELEAGVVDVGKYIGKPENRHLPD